MIFRAFAPKCKLFHLGKLFYNSFWKFQSKLIRQTLLDFQVVNHCPIQSEGTTQHPSPHVMKSGWVWSYFTSLNKLMFEKCPSYFITGVGLVYITVGKITNSQKQWHATKLKSWFKPSADFLTSTLVVNLSKWSQREVNLVERRVWVNLKTSRETDGFMFASYILYILQLPRINMSTIKPQ